MSTDEWPSLEEVKERYPVDPEGYARAKAKIDAEITGYEFAQLRKEDGLELPRRSS